MNKLYILFSLIFVFFISCSTSKEISLNKVEQKKSLSKNELEHKIRTLADEYSGIIGVYAKNLKTNETIEVNSDSLFPTASVIKLPILVSFFHKVFDGQLDPYSEIIIKSKDKVGGAGVLQFFHDETKIKAIDAAVLMIILSDNTATNAIIDLFGNEHDEKLKFVNSTTESYGLTNTKLLNKVFSYATKKKTPEALRFGLGYSSPKEMGKLLELIYNYKVIDSFYSDWIIRIMKNQQDDSMIRKFLPYYEVGKNEEIEVANKTGAVDNSRIDVGIIFTKKCDIILAIFTDLSKDTRWTQDNKAENAVAKAARIIFDYFYFDE